MIEGRRVPTIRARLSDDVDNRAPRSPRFRPITTRLHTKLLDYFIGKLIGRAISARGLRIESVIVVLAIHQKTVVVSANAAVRQVSIRTRSQASRILRDTWR